MVVVVVVEGLDGLEGVEVDDAAGFLAMMLSMVVMDKASSVSRSTRYDVLQ